MNLDENHFDKIDSLQIHFVKHYSVKKTISSMFSWIKFIRIRFALPIGLNYNFLWL